MKNIEWRHLKGLNELYVKKRTRLKITSNAFINQVLFNQKKLIRYKLGNHSIIEASDRYYKYYEENFEDMYNYYLSFFKKSGIENSAVKRYTEDDLKSLIFIFNNNKELKKVLTTEYTFSNRVFKGKGAKYLAGKPGLKKDVLKLLEIEEFPEKDAKNNQWRIVVDCKNPKVIVLCENIACLKVPTEYKRNGIELWYVGGNNTKPLVDLPLEKFKYPIYYFCDWDYHGLSIFSRVKNIFNSKGKGIELLEPLNLDNALPVNSPNHKSKWKPEKLSRLKESDYNDSQIKIIESLISKNIWIEEESMGLIELLESKNII
ncbi:DUF2220 family protein [Flavivirga amylovorans]|uniref:DUF2220 family protein n=1 Tax=Flavivirga amylovorans TaxID=870486 RepID=A0ABT8WXF3_9FLAO|nr:Wadjet anti-phage system protein JetD domain-containing protein [Flavivirga amylovorans]MDO5986153.1 DUF2220 family protein [Flavivirga amylovorans]